MDAKTSIDLHALGLTSPTPGLLRVLQWNASRSMHYANWIDWYDRCPYDIIIAQETGWRMTSEWSTPLCKTFLVCPTRHECKHLAHPPIHLKICVTIMSVRKKTRCDEPSEKNWTVLILNIRISTAFYEARQKRARWGRVRAVLR